MNTPKSQNPEGKVVAWMCEKARNKWNAEGSAQTGEMYMRRYVIETQADADMYGELGYAVTPLIPATTLTALQAELDALRDKLALAQSLTNRLYFELRGDGKGDGVSTAEGEG